MADMTESRGHISDKRRKGDTVQRFVCVCVSVGNRVRGTQHGVRHTSVVTGSISSYDPCCVPSPFAPSLICVPVSLYCEAENHLS